MKLVHLVGFITRKNSVAGKYFVQLGALAETYALQMNQPVDPPSLVR
jgi:hypothetical protein